MGRALWVALATTMAVGAGARSGAAGERLSLDVEGGLVWSGYNDVRIPGDGGTLFSFSEELSTQRSPFLRARVGFRLADRHHLLLLLAPLRLSADGTIARDVLFQGERFAANTPLEGRYRFDSYRLTYRYDVRRTAGLQIAVGLTVKVRDAAVGLSSSSVTSEKTNVGPVPLLHARARVALARATAALIEVDAAAAPQGRAEDVLIAVEREIRSGLTLRLGYRLLEGGADNDEVYTFTWLNYAVVGLGWRF